MQTSVNIPLFGSLVTDDCRPEHPGQQGLSRPVGAICSPLPPSVTQTLLSASYSYDPRFSVVHRWFKTGGGQLKRFAPHPRLPAPHSTPRGMGNHERLTEGQFAIGVISCRPEARKILALRVRAARQAEGAMRRRSSNA
jgi:hypothetical protein